MPVFAREDGWGYACKNNLKLFQRMQIFAIICSSDTKLYILKKIYFVL
jgi:hypothetical protein